jgi:hypothetical protein
MKKWGILATTYAVMLSHISAEGNIHPQEKEILCPSGSEISLKVKNGGMWRAEDIIVDGIKFTSPSVLPGSNGEAPQLSSGRGTALSPMRSLSVEEKGFILPCVYSVKNSSQNESIILHSQAMDYETCVDAGESAFLCKGPKEQ